VREYARNAFEQAFEFESPFLSSEFLEENENKDFVPEVASLAELLGELGSPQFRESLENLVNEALEIHAEQLANEYGDRETLEASGERMLNEHFYPLTKQAETMLEQFFERLEAYEAEALTDNEIERVAGEVYPQGQPMSPASEQFLGGLLRKAKKLASGAINFAKKGIEGAVKLAGKGLAAVGKFAFGPILNGLKNLGKTLLKYVVKFALNRLPASVRPMAKTLSEKLYRVLGEQESEFETEQTENEGIPAAYDIARLEMEFDIQAAQLLLTPDEVEMEHLVSQYGEMEQEAESSETMLDHARSQFITGLERLAPGESPGPVLEQFIPVALMALRPLVRTAIGFIGRDKVIGFLADLIGRLIRPILGSDFTRLLAPAIVDAGLSILGFETAETDPRVVATEALAATVEETLATVAGLPDHVLENETMLEDAVREAFEAAAASYFPQSVIRSELQETSELPGMWVRLPKGTPRKRYAKYTRSIPVVITPMVARTVKTFGQSTLADYFRDQLGLPANRTVKARLFLYKAINGTRGSTIARAERFPSQGRQLHPLTSQAAGMLLGSNAGLGQQPVSLKHPENPENLKIGQRLYRIELPMSRRPIRGSTTFLKLNIQTGEVRMWLYLSEPHCQQLAAELTKGRYTPAFALVKPLISRIANALAENPGNMLPENIRIIEEKPQLEQKTPSWLRGVAGALGRHIEKWALIQIIEYFKNRGDQIQKACSSQHDGITISITMTQVPGMEKLRLLSRGTMNQSLNRQDWRGAPRYDITTSPGYGVAP
jgi:hypothetical protein